MASRQGNQGKQSNTDQKLASNVLGLFESTIMGIAGSAPAYSIAATTVTLAVTVGLFGPGELFYSGIAMFGVVVAFHYMGKVRQNAGATYIWVRNALHPILGYLAGWSLVTASIIFGLVSTVPASTSLLSLFTNNDKIISNVHWTTLIGAAIFVFMVAIIAYGIKFTAKAQVIMTVTELGLLWIFDVLALLHHPHAHKFSWNWFSFSQIKSYSIPDNVVGTASSFDPKYVVATGLSAILIGAVSGAFFYWGWDVTANLNEETKEGDTNAGKGGIFGIFFVFFTFLFTLIAINMVLSDATLSSSGSILSDFAAVIVPGWFGKFIVVSVLLSTVATIETQMIQVTRTLFSMGRDYSMPSSFGNVHKKFQTPWNATIFTTVFVLLFFIGSQFIKSVNDIAQAGVAAIGIQICFYYALASISVIVLYRRHLTRNIQTFFMVGVWPALSGLFLIAVLIKVIPTLSHLALWVGVGTVAIGVIPMSIYWWQGADYFKRPTSEERHAQLP
ncbi:MAG: APC family permease [Actinomycetes bacterium]